MDKIYYITLLIDTYGELLTQKQRDVISAYYFNDLSLNEIGEEHGITRQAVQDMIKRTERLLEQYEAALKLVEKYIERKAKLDKAAALIDEEIKRSGAHLERVKELLLEAAD